MLPRSRRENCSRSSLAPRQMSIATTGRLSLPPAPRTLISRSTLRSKVTLTGALLSAVGSTTSKRTQRSPSFL